MKKFYFYACLLSVGMMFTACESDDSDFNPEIESVVTKTVTFEGDYWTALVDNPQYGGNLIYSPDEYKWVDSDNTKTGFRSLIIWYP